MTTVMTQSNYADKLRADLDRMVNSQIDSPEFQLLLTTKLTMRRAQFEARLRPAPLRPLRQARH